MNTEENNTQLPQSSDRVSAFLTGKAKQDFRKWYQTRLSVMTYSEILNINDLTVYSSLVVEWFDSVDLLIGIYPNLYGKFVWHLNKNNTYKRWSNDMSYESRAEATYKSIETANELYNENDV